MGKRSRSGKFTSRKKRKAMLTPAIKTEIRSLVRRQAERKRISYTWNHSTASTTGVDTKLLASITGGDGSTNRDGHQIRLSFLSGDLFTTASDETNVIRLVVYRKKTADTLATDALTVYGAIDPDKYIIMKDDLITMSPTGDSFVRRRKYKFNMKNRRARYDATTGDPNIGDDIHIYYVSDSTVIDHPTLSGHWLLYYYDM